MADSFEEPRSAELHDELRVHRPRRAAPADAVRPTRAEVNLGNLRHNLRVVERAVGRTAAGPGRTAAGPEVWGVLKADAYGHGAPAIARTLERAGVSGLCVALLEEGLELRAAGIALPIVVMGGYYGPQHRGLEEVVEAGLVPVLYHAEQVERLAALARAKDGKRAAFHLKVDTGMGRLGVRARDVDPLFDQVVATREIELVGLMSHLACADDPDPAPTLAQVKLFESARAALARRGVAPKHCHLANSAAALALPEARYSAVRPGIALYGVSPFPSGFPVEAAERAANELRPVMRIRSEIVALRQIPAGEAIGYGHTWRADGPRTVATIPIGYADGLSRALSNKGSVLVRGKRAPIAGVVSMDLTAIDVTGIDGAALGDEVVVLGPQDGPLGSDAITADEIASLVGTIPWEVVTNISRRVPRFFREP
ncbi:MAG TPA: alanine racemase [Polyangiaceae bacterium]|nr:alanine racemase [Polyangiaceae bacterium]